MKNNEIRLKRKKKQSGIKPGINMFNNKELSQEAKNTLYILGNQEESIDYQRLNFKRDKNVLFDF